MDEEKINALAKSLKDSHLAANMEEAYAKAKQILEADGGSETQTVGELMKEEGKTEALAEKDAEEVEEIKEDLEKAEKEEKEEIEEIKKVEEEIDKADEELKELTE